MRLALPLLVAVLCVPQVARPADVAAGKAIFDSTCNNCHSLAIGVNEVGPSLWHIVGRPSASVAGFAYSDGLKSLHTEWSGAALQSYLENPSKQVHDVQMFFKGLPQAQDRTNVIAYLQSRQ